MRGSYPVSYTHLEDINSYIFAKDHVDLQHTYIDGTKIEANANRYTWVWKKSCVKDVYKRQTLTYPDIL